MNHERAGCARSGRHEVRQRYRRKVGNACSTNNLALAIPCHRVLHRDGTLSGGYHWGDARQRVLLDRETKAKS